MKHFDNLCGTVITLIMNHSFVYTLIVIINIQYTTPTISHTHYNHIKGTAVIWLYISRDTYISSICADQFLLYAVLSLVNYFYFS